MIRFLSKANTWSERQQVAVIIAMAGIVIVVLWILVLGPLNLMRRSLEQQIRDMRGQLAEKNFLVGEDVLRERQRMEILSGQRMLREWEESVGRLTAIGTVGDDAELRVGHIDFKVALLEARYRMRRKAQALNINLPRDLGMEETVPSGEDARKLLHQLRALEKLTDLALDLQVGAIRALDPLPPIRHPAPDGTVFLEEYPVRVRFEGGIDQVFEWVRATLQPGQTFALRGLRIDGTPRGAPSTLTVTAVMSALVFPGDIRELLGPAQERVLYTEPLGH